MNVIQSILVLIALLTLTAGAEEVKFAQVGDRVILEPPVGTDSKVHYIYWKNSDDTDVVWSNPFGSRITKDLLSDGSLVIDKIKDEHFRTFICVTKSGDKILFTRTYRILKVNVTLNPPSPLLPEETLTLICNVESLQGQKKPEIHWLNPQSRQVGSKGSATVKVTGQHNGRWTCVVTNNKKEHHATVSVTVVDLSPAPTSPQYTSKSCPLTIPCSIHVSWDQIKAKGIQEGNWHFIPKPGSSLTPHGSQRLFSLSLEDKLAWKADQNRGLTTASDLTKGNLSLMRKQGREDDSGDYVCSLNFKNGLTLNRTVQVKVLQIISSPGTELISGQQLNLTCGLGHPLPSDLKLRWVPPEQSSSSLTSDRLPAHLTIPEVGSEDSGKWRCELWRNDTRLTSADITLKIEPRLSVWMIVIICSITAIVILLILIFVCIAYRRRQRRMRHLGHRICHCKTPKPKGFYRT
ncbi:CD4-1 molecule [Larimichthys crocea]|uniref:CD4-1 molecule n=1 Tax=Larimichthys crocea TaxID=215358 RepID=UPI000F5E17E8|nr:T-cell surface glycoprotein CD4 [Larimichthys crocea]XP_027145531.1 T-cell surface glycoprotein CD4 [Larimichthys crocea]